MPRSTETFMSVGTDGSISFDFTGHISAQGIDMLLSLFASPPNDRIIRWHFQTLTGESLVEVQAFRVGVTTEAVLMAFAPGRLTQTFLAVDQTNGTGTGANRVIAQSGAFGATLIDGIGQSSFPQLAALSNRKINFGIAVCTFIAGGQSPYLAVNHGLGVVPVAVLVTPGITSGGNTTCCAATNSVWTSSAFQVTAFNPTVFPAAGETIPVSWMAIG